MSICDATVTTVQAFIYFIQ